MEVKMGKGMGDRAADMVILGEERPCHAQATANDTELKGEKKYLQDINYSTPDLMKVFCLFICHVVQVPGSESHIMYKTANW